MKVIAGAAKLTLWENYVHKLDEDCSYTLKNFVVREYQEKKYLSMPRDGSEVFPLDDIGDTQDIDSDSDTDLPGLQCADAVVIGVPQLDTYKACLTCKARVEPQTPPLGRCSKCAMLQRFDLCPDQWSAKLLLQCGCGLNKHTVTLHAFGRMVNDLAGQTAAQVAAEVQETREMLLKAPPLSTISYKHQVITGFTRP